VVIGPLPPDCVVLTGSHDLGYRASYTNDENLLFIRDTSLSRRHMQSTSWTSIARVGCRSPGCELVGTSGTAARPKAASDFGHDGGTQLPLARRFIAVRSGRAAAWLDIGPRFGQEARALRGARARR